jgi:ornithine carrier protein
MVSKVFEHPFDLTKVRLQSQVLDSTARFNGPIDCLVKTWRREGVKGLYRVRSFDCSTFSLHSRTNGCIIQGLPAPIVGAMAENASLFLSYGELQNLIRLVTHQPVQEEKLALHYLALAAAGAGAITSFLLSVSTTS